MQVTEGQVVTVEAGGERASYVVTDLNVDNFMTCGSHVNPREMKLLRLAEQPSVKSDAAAKDEPGQTGNAVIEFEPYAPPRINKRPYCEKTLVWPDEANTTTHHATIDWFTCPRKEAKRYRVTVEELPEDPIPTEHEVV